MPEVKVGSSSHWGRCCPVCKESVGWSSEGGYYVSFVEHIETRHPVLDEMWMSNTEPVRGVYYEDFTRWVESLDPDLICLMELT